MCKNGTYLSKLVSTLFNIDRRVQLSQKMLKLKKLSIAQSIWKWHINIKSMYSWCRNGPFVLTFFFLASHSNSNCCESRNGFGNFMSLESILLEKTQSSPRGKVYYVFFSSSSFWPCKYLCNLFYFLTWQGTFDQNQK